MQTEPILFKEFTEAAAKRSGKAFLPGGRSRGEVPPPPPTFSESELKDAQKESYKQGFLEGTEEGKRQQTTAQADAERTLVSTLSTLAQSLTPVVDDYKQQMVRLRSEMPKLALEIARKAAGPALDEAAHKTIEETVTRCLHSLPASPDITLTVHDSLKEALQTHLSKLAETIPAAQHITVQASSELAVSDCKIGWRDGAFIRNTEALWQQIGQAVDNISAGEQFAAQADADALGTEKATTPAPPATDTQPEPQTAEASEQPAVEAQPEETPEPVQDAPVQPESTEQPPAKE